jgi:two-component system, OmpR family, response regulator
MRTQRRRASRAEAKSMRILIVEDDEVIASTMSRGLTLHGYVVDHAPSAEAAAAALLSERFDLAIVDLGLPREDGTSLVRRIRRTDRTLRCWS